MRNLNDLFTGKNTSMENKLEVMVGLYQNNIDNHLHYFSVLPRSPDIDERVAYLDIHPIPETIYSILIHRAMRKWRQQFMDDEHSVDRELLLPRQAELNGVLITAVPSYGAIVKYERACSKLQRLT